MHLIFLSDSLIHVLYPNVYIYMCTVKSTLRSLGMYNIYGVRLTPIHCFEQLNITLCILVVVISRVLYTYSIGHDKA